MAVDVGTAVAYLDLNMTAFNSGLQQAQSALQTFQNNSSTASQKWIATGGLITNIGQSLTRNVTVPLANLGQSSVQAARDFESAFAGVKKTIDESRFKEYSVTWDDLSDAIQEMANETGISAEEIAGVMEYAGQLGVELGDGGKNIIEFTKQMTMLGVATNMTAQEAALDLAKFMNVTGLMNQSTEESAANVRGLGSAVTALGNNFATQEADVVQMSQRLASAGTVAGLTAQEILALSTAISSAGIKTEAGASAMSTTLTMIERIVSGVAENSEDKLQVISRVSGMTAEQFAKSWREKPIEAVQAFLVGLGNANTETESMVAILDELGMTSIRQSNLLRALGLSAENMSDAVNIANQSWQDAYESAQPAGALVEEFNKRLETLDSRLNMLNERWKDVKREIAEVLIPILERLMDKISQLIEWWNSLDDGTKKLIVTIGLLAAAIPVVTTVLGNLITMFGVIKGLHVAKSVAETSTVVQKFGDIILGSVYNNCGNAAIAISRMNGNLEMSAETANIGGAAMKKFSGELVGATEATKGATKATEAATVAGTTLATVMKGIFGLLGVVGGAILSVVNFVKMWKDGIDLVHSGLLALGIALVAIGAILFGAPAAVTAVVAAVVAAVAFVVLWIKENWEDIKGWWSNTAVPWLQDAWGNVVQGFAKLGEGIVSAFWSSVKSISEVADNIRNAFLGVVDKLKADIAQLKEVGHQIGEAIRGFIDNALEGAKQKINDVKETFAGIGEALKNGLKTAVESVKSVASALFETIGNIVSGIVSGVVNSVTDIFSKLYDKVVGFVDKIKEKVGDSFIGKAFSTIKDWFDGSHENGLAYVPFDGYVAQLHKGERVLTADENRQYSSGGGNGTTINFYSNERIDEYTAARELRRVTKDIELGLV